jgi:hypothetical protein
MVLSQQFGAGCAWVACDATLCRDLHRTTLEVSNTYDAVAQLITQRSLVQVQPPNAAPASPDARRPDWCPDLGPSSTSRAIRTSGSGCLPSARGRAGSRPQSPPGPRCRRGQPRSGLAHTRSGRSPGLTRAGHALSFAKTASDSPGEDPWATGGLSTPDDRRADGPPLYRKAVGMLRRSGPALKDVIVRAGRMTAETTNSSRGSTLVAGRGPVGAGLCCPADVAMM